MPSTKSPHPRTRKPPAKSPRASGTSKPIAPPDDANPQCTATTARGAQCRRRAVAGAEMCTVHLGAPVGRPAKLDDAVTVTMVEILRFGGYVETAAAAAGVARATFHAWIERGGAEGTKAEDAPYREFRERIELARAEGEAHNVELIAKAATKDWKAAAWMLERQFPERWAGPIGRRTAALLGDPEDPPGAGADLDGPDVIDDQRGPDGEPL